MSLRIAIIGGGAAGIFGAISAAHHARKQGIQTKITVLEASTKFLTKVAISGGGRCNVTHHQYEPRQFCKSYPRGEKELISPMQRFQAKDTVQWFEDRNVRIKVEEDGRMFPVSDDSSSIVNCLLDEARELGIGLSNRYIVNKIQYENHIFTIKTSSNELSMDCVLIATGSSPLGYTMAKKLGHTIEELAPSLFSFHIQHALLKNLEGISFPNAWVEMEVGDKTFEEKAPILITHWGLSGPGILKISAWAAREMKKAGYKAKLTVNWLGIKNIQVCREELETLKNKHSKSKVTNIRPQGITQRFWDRVLEVCGLSLDMQWAHATNKDLEILAKTLARCEFQVDGKSRNKEEFVECGGVSRKEIDWKTMQSKIIPGLFFAGEIMDVDGITGGFNLQHAWTTGYIAGINMITSRRET